LCFDKYHPKKVDANSVTRMHVDSSKNANLMKSRAVD